jgi:hypothetical protein
MRRIILGAAAAALSIAAIAGPVAAASDNANQNACFGQGRAAYAVANGGTDASVGFYASQRKGDNASINAAYRDSCQAA